MSRTIVPPHRLALATIFLALPSVLILGWLWWGGAIDPKLAAGLGLLALLHGGAVVAFYWRDVAAVTQYLHRLRDGTRDAALPAVRSSMVRPMVAAVAQLHRGWQRRLDSCQATRLASEGVIEALPEPLLVIDQGRKVVRGNAAARHLFGSRLLERDLAEGLRSPAVLDAVDAVLREGGGRQVEFTLTGPADRIFAALVEPFVADGEEGVRSVVVSLHDITAIRRSEKMHADFVANASHELRTPLSAMLGFIETLRGPAKDDPEAQGRFLGIMHQQASRMSRLIADLLSLSRIELHEHNPPTARVDLAELARNAAAAFELKAAARRIRLRLDIPDALPEVVADEDQMTQVVQNLIDNAIKYSRESTEVTVALGVAEGTAVARPAKRFVSIAVSDQGDGIPREHLPRLTERFYRVDAARSRQMGGTGLGLAIVQHIVNRHRGRLVIDSEEGRGSVFTVYLPAAAAAGGASGRNSDAA